MGITSDKAQARCLDLTRLVSRVGRGPWTGIDRVEFAYLQALIADDVPVFAIVRLPGGYGFLDRGGMVQLCARLDGSAKWGPADVKSRLMVKSNSRHRAAVSDIRSLAIAVVRKGRLRGRIGGLLPAGIVYLNVGHSNISPEVMAAFRSVAGARVTVMLHDAIPLDYPEFQRPGSAVRFDAKLRLVAQNADLVLCNSAQTKSDVTRHFAQMGRCPKLEVVHLGVDLVAANARALPGGLDLTQPYFVTLGTIEPRKNHGLLLDIWERLAGDAGAPRLIIIGQRGWENRQVFARLDGPPAQVSEYGNLSDGAVAAVLESAAALLFPSISEGYGLPAAEAAARGVPVICSDLSVFREILGEYPIYADPTDLYDWETKIRKLAHNREVNNSEERRKSLKIALPTWAAHFNQVLRLT